MTVDYQYYNLGAVIGIMTFVFWQSVRCLYTDGRNPIKTRRDFNETKKKINNILVHLF